MDSTGLKVNPQEETSKSFGSYLLSPFYGSSAKPPENAVMTPHPIDTTPSSESQSEQEPFSRESYGGEIEVKAKSELSEAEKAKLLKKAKRAERKARANTNQESDNCYSEVEQYAKYRTVEIEHAKKEISDLKEILLDNEFEIKTLKQILETSEARILELKSELDGLRADREREREYALRTAERQKEEQRVQEIARKNKARQEALTIRALEDRANEATLQMQSLEQARQAEISQRKAQEQQTADQALKIRLLYSEAESLGI